MEAGVSGQFLLNALSLVEEEHKEGNCALVYLSGPRENILT